MVPTTRLRICLPDKKKQLRYVRYTNKKYFKTPTSHVPWRRKLQERCHKGKCNGVQSQVQALFQEAAPGPKRSLQRSTEISSSALFTCRYAAVTMTTGRVPSGCYASVEKAKRKEKCPARKKPERVFFFVFLFSGFLEAGKRGKLQVDVEPELKPRGQDGP